MQIQYLNNTYLRQCIHNVVTGRGFSQLILKAALLRWLQNSQSPRKGVVQTGRGDSRAKLNVKLLLYENLIWNQMSNQ